MVTCDGGAYFYRVRHARPPFQGVGPQNHTLALAKILVTRMLTRDLIAVDNLLYICQYTYGKEACKQIQRHTGNHFCKFW